MFNTIRTVSYSSRSGEISCWFPQAGRSSISIILDEYLAHCSGNQVEFDIHAAPGLITLDLVSGRKIIICLPYIRERNWIETEQDYHKGREVERHDGVH